MANASVNTNSTYAGELARPYVAAAILSADTIANNYISVLENVHYKAVLRPFSGAAIQANDDCAFTTPSTNALTVGEAVLTASALKVNEQVCNADLRSTWESTQMRGQSSSAPADFTSYVAQYVAAKVAENVEHNIWAGEHKQILDEAAPYASFKGIIRNIQEGSPDRETVSALPLAVATSGTGIGILSALALITGGGEGAPAAIAGDANTKIFMSRASAQLYYQALAATYNLPFLNDGLVARYAGYDIITPGGFPDNVLLISKVDNLYFGTNLLTDHIQASVLDLTGVTGDDVTRVIMQFSGGTQVVDLNGLAIWRTETAS